MKTYSAIALFLLSACGGATASSSGAAEPTLAPTGEVALGVWFEVRSSSGRALPVGSGMRFRADGFDVASDGLAQSMTSTCTPVAGGLDCEGAAGPLSARARTDGSVAVHQEPNDLVVARASEADSATWSAAVIASDEQRAACSAAADCCIAMENQLGIACDINALLGARTRESCRAGLEGLRSALASRGGEAPSECR